MASFNERPVFRPHVQSFGKLPPDEYVTLQTTSGLFICFISLGVMREEAAAGHKGVRQPFEQGKNTCLYPKIYKGNDLLASMI